jgi:hypothetical protein
MPVASTVKVEVRSCEGDGREDDAEVAVDIFEAAAEGALGTLLDG